MSNSNKNKIKTLYIGHRGCRGLSDENTLESVEKAISLGVDMIEIDIQKTKDNEFILMHDETIDRTTQGKGRVTDLTLAEVRNIKTKKNNSLSTLQEIIEKTKKKNVQLFIDMKNNMDYEKKLIDLLIKYNIMEKVIIDTERFESVKKLKEICPELKVAISPLNPLIYIFNPVKFVKKYDADYLDIFHFFINKKMINSLHENNIKVTVWVVNRKKRILDLIKMGVDGIMSDYPNVFFEDINGYSNYPF